ncbi:lipopolysaccharide biosynthesis protein [Steroidobacter sp. S1-65]|uniref:Lipopolysaccharide biosynthesis protein n=1 Tax=Steroidobacter gossypii TaxID=2805490 RepID=A0ABS1WQE0_9GAMM|nr:lipopolysaccharide biosynthesis protein [Steroidobacter gossypii]MBM0103186.1 lipopolysaccharide biosynthesis protein [Steroidobacter gossypii]
MSAVRNVRWVGMIQITRISVQLLALLVLSRLLTPADFGLVAIVFAINNFALLLRDMGTASAIIQRDVLDEQTVLTAHWSNCCIGLGLSVILLAFAHVLEGVFKAPGLAPLVQLSALSFPFLSGSTVHQALLERASKFNTVARIEITALLTGFAVAVTAAFLGAGAYSLVLQTLTVAVLSGIQFWIASDMKMKWGWSSEHARGLWGYSGSLFGFNLVNYFSRNADTMIIGRMLGPAALGPYSLAYRVMLFPLQNLTFVATRALFPMMSRQQHSPKELGAMHLRLLSVISFFTAPMMAGLFVLREPFVDVALGDGWDTVAALILWLAPIGFIQSLVSAGGVVFQALGRTDLLFRLGVLSSVLHVAGFISGVHWGLMGVAAAYFVVTLVNSVISLGVLLHLMQQSVPRLLGAVLPAIAKSLIMATLLHFADIELQALQLPPLARLIGLSAGGAVIFLALTHIHLMPADRDVMRLFMKDA